MDILKGPSPGSAVNSRTTLEVVKHHPVGATLQEYLKGFSNSRDRSKWNVRRPWYEEASPYCLDQPKQRFFSAFSHNGAEGPHDVYATIPTTFLSLLFLLHGAFPVAVLRTCISRESPSCLHCWWLFVHCRLCVRCGGDCLLRCGCWWEEWLLEKTNVCGFSLFLHSRLMQY